MIEGGYYIKARKIQESTIQHSPPHFREVWDWLLMKANHTPRKSNGRVIERGQVFCTYGDIREGLHWWVGARKMRYSKSQIESAFKAYKRATMVTTSKTTRGMLITLLNYDYYQNPKNYENHTESHDGDASGTTVKPHYTQELKKKEEKEPSRPKPGRGDEGGEKFYRTGRKRKLKGKRLEAFIRFWNAFDYKDGKAEASDAWLDIPELTETLVNVIIAAAKIEAELRPGIRARGSTPKMAQGWINKRRWEDEKYKKHRYKNKNICKKCKNESTFLTDGFCETCYNEHLESVSGSIKKSLGGTDD